jgi:putative heme-binding domain-containing protein
MELTAAHGVLLCVVSLVVVSSVEARAPDEPPVADSALVKLLKSPRVPEARQGTIIEMIGKRGTATDLDFVYQKVLDGGFSPVMRAKALDALAEAALTRDLKPSRNRERLVAVLRPGEAPAAADQQKAAVKLAGLWKLAAACDALVAIARLEPADDELRALALGALATIGGDAGRSRIEALAARGSPVGVRLWAVAALVRLDAAAAAARAAELLPEAAALGLDLKPLLAPFINQRGAGAVLAAEIARRGIPADPARLALRAVYALGLADPALKSALGRAAGISTEVKPPTPAELSALVAEVAASGDPIRGESIFRRADLNCMTCHALAKAGGEVGPDLSSVGQSSPPDYIINSIFVPDQSIKEQYHTVVVQTTDGQVYQGIVTDKDNERIVLKESTGALRVLAVSSIEDQKPGGSLMPKGLVNLMTRHELVDLVRFLSELGKPGPYAIRATPTIQRWHVLKSVSPALAAEVPELSTLRAAVLAAAPAQWATVYSRIGGALPLGEAVGIARSKIVYLQGELEVSAGGAVGLHLDSPEGVSLWVDEQLAPAASRVFTATVSPGRRAVTVRVDTAARKSPAITVEVARPQGTPAELTVVGGK